MKKLYTTLALAAFTAVTAMAATEVTLSENTAGLQWNLGIKTFEFEAAKNVAASKALQTTPPTTALNPDAVNTLAEETWTSLGTGSFKDFMLGDLFGLTNPGALEVEIEQSTTDPNRYRIVEPYKNYPVVTGLPYSSAQATPLVLNVAGPNNEYFYIEEFNTGFSYQGTALSVSDQVASVVAQYGFDAVYNMWGPSDFGVFENNTFTYKTAVDDDGYSVLLAIYGTQKMAINKNVEFAVALPGAEVKDYSIHVDAPYCAPENSFNIGFQAGDDVAQVGFAVMKGSFAASQANFQYVAGMEINKTTNKSGGVTFTAPNTEKPTEYTVFFVTYDAEGNYQAGAAEYLCGMPNDDDNWTSHGMTKFTEDWYSSIYQGTMPEADVEIQVNKTNTGLIRLVNVYKEFFAESTAQQHAMDDHDHYIFIDMSDPEKVFVETSPAGFDLGDGAARVSSWAYLYQQAGKTEEETAPFYGKVANGVITFPKDALAESELHYANGNWMDANANEAFSLKLPESVGVNNINVDAKDNYAPVEYFNLQGQRVANPAAGQLLIVRQGDKVAKTTIK